MNNDISKPNRPAKRSLWNLFYLLHQCSITTHTKLQLQQVNGKVHVFWECILKPYIYFHLVLVKFKNLKTQCTSVSQQNQNQFKNNINNLKMFKTNTAEHVRKNIMSSAECYKRFHRRQNTIWIYKYHKMAALHTDKQRLIHWNLIYKISHQIL